MARPRLRVNFELKGYRLIDLLPLPATRPVGDVTSGLETAGDLLTNQCRASGV